MKPFLLSLTIGLITVAAAAQYKINLIMNSTPAATLSEWSNRRETLTLIVSSQAGLNIPVKIKIEIKTSDGTVIATTDLAKAAIYTFQQANTMLYAADVVPLENILFTGRYKTTFLRTGKLSSDNYMLCVQLVTPTDYRSVSDQSCKNFYLATTQLPILMKPYNEEILDATIAQTAITFRWTPVVPKLPQPAYYRIQVFEVQPHQAPVQALRSNQPLLDQQIMGVTQYIWRPQLDMKNNDSLTMPAKKFIWTIQSLDANNEPVVQTDGNGEARSEPLVFYVGNKQ